MFLVELAKIQRLLHGGIKAPYDFKKTNKSSLGLTAKKLKRISDRKLKSLARRVKQCGYHTISFMQHFEI